MGIWGWTWLGSAPKRVRRLCSWDDASPHAPMFGLHQWPWAWEQGNVGLCYQSGTQERPRPKALLGPPALYWLPRWLSAKESACQCRGHRRLESIPGAGRPPGAGDGSPLQYSCLGNPMGREDRRATVQGAAKDLDTTERLRASPLLKCF